MVKDSRRPSLVLARNSSVRSFSSSSSRPSFSSWDSDASVRMFAERSREAVLIDEGYYLTIDSGRTSPDQPSTPTDLAPMPIDHTSPITERNPFAVSFSADMPTSDLVAAAREAAALVTLESDPYLEEESPMHFVGFGTLSKKEVVFRRPARASKNRYAASTRRFVDILT